MNDIVLNSSKSMSLSANASQGFETKYVILKLKKLIPVLLGVLTIILCYGGYVFYKTQRAELMRLVGEETAITGQGLLALLKKQELNDLHQALRNTRDILLTTPTSQHNYELFILDKGIIKAEISTLNSLSIGKKFTDYYAEKITPLPRAFVQDGDIGFLNEAKKTTLALPLRGEISLVVLRNFAREETHFITAQKRLAGLTLALLVSLFAFLYMQSKFITRFREREQTALKQATIMDKALVSGRSGLWAYHLESQIFSFSNSMLEMAGLPLEKTSFNSREVSQIVHADDLVQFSLSTQQESEDHSFRIQHVNGDILWIRSRSKREGDFVMGLAVDITEQRSIEDATQQAEDRLSEALDALPSAFALWDAQNRLVLTNKAFLDLHGTTSDELKKGALRHKLLSKMQGPRVTLIGPQSNEKEQTSLLKIDTKRWLQVISRRTKDGGLATVATDISRLKRHEEELSRKSDELVSKVKELERTKLSLEIGREQLAETAQRERSLKEKADVASHAKSDFMAKMSHELRTPLNAILGFSELMHKRQFGELAEETYSSYPTCINNAGHQLNDLVNDILDVTRIEAGKREINLEIFPIIPLVQEILPQIEINNKDKGVKIIQDLQDIHIRADKRAVRQILLNLLGNAVKFSHNDSKVQLEITQTAQFIVITVRDNGIGIPYNEIPRLMSPFEQVEGTWKRNHQGAGLGLYIVKSLAKLHGGNFELESIEGESTRASVTLPL